MNRYPIAMNEHGFNIISIKPFPGLLCLGQVHPGKLIYLSDLAKWILHNSVLLVKLKHLCCNFCHQMLKERHFHGLRCSHVQWGHERCLPHSGQPRFAVQIRQLYKSVNFTDPSTLQIRQLQRGRTIAWESPKSAMLRMMSRPRSSFSPGIDTESTCFRAFVSAITFSCQQ